MIALEKLLETDHPVLIRPVGLSMHPFIRRDDRIVIESGAGADVSRISFGQCVIFRSGGERWLIHRIIGRKNREGQIITKGDALVRSDRPVDQKNIRGVITGIERAGSKRFYRLDRGWRKRASSLIAFLSCLESFFSRFLPKTVPRRKEGRPDPLLGRIIKAPKWLLTRLLFP